MSDTTPDPGCADASATTEAHERFAPFVGEFRSKVTMWMGPGEPFVSTGTMINTLELGGRFLRQSYKGDATEGPFPNFEGHGFWGFNTVDGRYEGMWIDNATTALQTEQGHVEGNVWTMRGSMTNPQTGQQMRKKSVITLHDADRHEMEMLFESVPDQWHKGMHIEYTRV